MEKRSISSYLKAWVRALSIEINYMKKHGGEKYTVGKGEYLGQQEDAYLYRFERAADLYLFDGAQVRLVHQHKESKGEVIGTEGFDLYLKIDAFIGQEVDELDIYNEPWELLQALIDRLTEAKDYKQKIVRIKRLMRGDSPVRHKEHTSKNALHEVLLRARYNRTTYIWGPPGTGKTYTLSKIAASYYRKSKRILLLSHSNAAVDGLLQETARQLKKKEAWKKGKLIRYGATKSSGLENIKVEEVIGEDDPDLAQEMRDLQEERVYLSRYPNRAHQLQQVNKKLNALRNKWIEAEKNVFDQAYIVGTTLSKAAIDRLLYQSEFDMVVVDEISMAYAPQIAFAATLGKRIVVCGDFKQLPPVSQSSHAEVKKWLQRDLFEQTGLVEQVESGEIHPHLFMLTKQRRMHKDISAFTNRYIYSNRVADHPSVTTSREVVASSRPFAHEAALMLNIGQLHSSAMRDAASGSRYNLITAVLAVSLMLRARKASSATLGYVTPYKSQAKLINAFLQDIEPASGIIAATVHKFQGAERDIMIFDTVDTKPQSKPGLLLTNENSDRLVNVAVTRSKGKFIMLSDESFAQQRVPKERALWKLVNHFNENQKVYQPQQFLKEVIQHPKLIWYHPSNSNQLKKDLYQARQQILLCIPYASLIPQEIRDVLNSFKGEVTVLTREPTEVRIDGAHVISSPVPMSLLIIDESTIWINIPYGGKNEAFMAARIESKLGAKQLIRSIDFTEDKTRNQETKMYIETNKPQYSLSNYLRSWDRCESCQHMREVEITKKGKVRFICYYCGKTSGATRLLVEKYLNYVHAVCKACKQPMNVDYDENKGVYACCPSCKKEVLPRDLL
ncbi:MAG: AAA domain-containing protein [Priestia megaterium]